MRQKRISLPFDESFVLGRHAGVFLAPDFVQSVGQMPHDMELVKDNLGLGSVFPQGVAKRLPHVHDRKANRFVSLMSHLHEEPVHVLLGAAEHLTHPDGTLLVEIGDDDCIDMPLADGDFVNADGFKTSGYRVFGKEPFHINLVHSSDLIPREMIHLGDFLYGHGAALLADELLESLGESSGFGQPRESFPSYGHTAPAVDPAVFELKIDTGAAGVPIPDSMGSSVVKTSGGLSA